MKIQTESMLFYTVFTALLVLINGCEKKEGQPTLKNPRVIPTVLNLLEHHVVFFSVDAIDPKGEIASIHLSSPNVPEITFTLNNKGIQGDKQARDNTWSILVRLPPPEEVPVGTIYLIFKAIDKDQLPIMIKNPDDLNVPLKVESRLKIVSHR